MEVDKGVIAAYLIGGFLCGDVVRGLLGRKAASPPGIAIAVGLGAALLAFWIVRMYRRAAVQPDPELPVAASTRYARPVTATICFFVGMVVVFL